MSTEDNKVKVLQISIGGGVFTGVASYLYQYYKYMDRDKVQFDFLFTNKNSMRLVMNEDIFSGSTFYELCAINEKTHSNDYKRVLAGISNVLNQKHYDIVVVNTSVVLMILVCMLAVKRNKVNCFIAHAHNGDIILNKSSLRSKLSLVSNCLDGFCRRLICRNANYLFACSRFAGEKTFGSEAVNLSNFRVIKNAISVEKFKYNPLVREEIRSMFLDDLNAFVYGNVGQLAERKNQTFLIETFAKIKKQQKSACLWLIGEGPDRGKLEELIKDYNLTDSIRLFGQRDDVSNLMQAMDCFIFTTKSEGLGIVAIESQAAGLLTMVSDGVPKDVLITDLAHQYCLNDGSDTWAKSILDIVRSRQQRRCTDMEIKQAGYEIRTESKAMQDFFVEQVNHSNFADSKGPR
ncbi:glycosyltransferase [Hungatella hathewayi]|uniref:glycosyltransferase n=1 Tax=Hungatella hathewayi TaxID=154046 RepID=UPI003569540A